MRKLYQTEARINQEVCQILAKLKNNQAQGVATQQVIDELIGQYETTINLSFSANILHNGLEYAGRLYNHIVKIEYKRFTQFVIKQSLDSSVKEYIVLRLKKTKKRLLLQSPMKHENSGLEILYLVTGGKRKKYCENHQIIKQIYKEIHKESKKNAFNYFKDRCQIKYQHFKAKLEYRKWMIKSYIWH